MLTVPGWASRSARVSVRQVEGRLLTTEHELGQGQVREGLGGRRGELLGPAHEGSVTEVLLSVGQPAQPVLGDAELEQELGEVGVAHRRRPPRGRARALASATASATWSAPLRERRSRRLWCWSADTVPGCVASWRSSRSAQCRPASSSSDGPPGPRDDAPGLGVLLEAGAGLPEEAVHAALVACQQSRPVLGQHGAGFVVLTEREEAAQCVRGQTAAHIEPGGAKDGRAGLLDVDAAGDHTAPHHLEQQGMDAVALLRVGRVEVGRDSVDQEAGGLQGVEHLSGLGVTGEVPRQLTGEVRLAGHAEQEMPLLRAQAHEHLARHEVRDGLARRLDELGRVLAGGESGAGSSGQDQGSAPALGAVDDGLEDLGRVVPACWVASEMLSSRVSRRTSPRMIVRWPRSSGTSREIDRSQRVSRTRRRPYGSEPRRSSTRRTQAAESRWASSTTTSRGRPSTVAARSRTWRSSSTVVIRVASYQMVSTSRPDVASQPGHAECLSRAGGGDDDR